MSKGIFMVMMAAALLLAACLPGVTSIATSTPSAVPPAITVAPPTAAPPTVAATTVVAPSATPAATGTATKVPATASPTATVTPAKVDVRIAVRAADNSVQLADTKIAADPAGSPAANGFLPLGGVVSGTIYALGFADRPSAVAVDAGGTHPLDFIQDANYGLAVWPGDATSGPRLAWGTQYSYSVTQSSLISSAPDGSQLDTLLTEGSGPGQPYQLVAERWSADGKTLYYSKEPYGLGGYILFGGASSLYRINPADKQSTALIPLDLQAGRFICLDALSTDERLVADHCTQKVITVRDLTTGQATTIQPPAEVANFGPMGSARFSPDNKRVAFALAKGNPDGEQGWVAVSDALSGTSKLIATGAAGQYFTVAAWLNGSTLLLESNALQCNPTCTSELWTVGVDGSSLVKVAEGTFITLAPPAQP